MQKNVKIGIKIFREEATLALVGFHAYPQSWSNWNLDMLILKDEGKLETPEKNPWNKAKTNNKFIEYLVWKTSGMVTEYTARFVRFVHIIVLPSSPRLHSEIMERELGPNDARRRCAENAQWILHRVEPIFRS